MTWVPGYTRTPITGRPGLPDRAGFPFRFTLHTTEGWKAAHAIETMRAGTGPPHVTCEYPNINHQHIPLNRGAYALRHDYPPETNAAANIQIELVGFARETRDWGTDRIEWVADILFDLATEAKKVGMIDDTFRLTWPTFYDSPVSLLSNRRSPFRSRSNWETGKYTIYGHQHVPAGNTHWDPGAIPIAAIAQAFHARWAPDDPTDSTTQLRQRVRRLEARNARLVKALSNERDRIQRLKAQIRRLVDHLGD